MKYYDEHCEENSSKYHTGKECIEKDCKLPAGTAWSDYWCWKHNAMRMDRITVSMEKIAQSMGIKL